MSMCLSAHTYIYRHYYTTSINALHFCRGAAAGHFEPINN